MLLRAPGRPAPAQRPGAQHARRSRRRLVLVLVAGMLAPLLGGAPAVAADPPTVTSIERPAGAPSTVGAGATVTYVVTFSEPVTGVDTSDFTVNLIGALRGSVASVSGSGTTWQVVIGSLSGWGVLRLELNTSGTGIVGDGGEPIQGGFASGPFITVDTFAPLAPEISSSATTTNPSPTISGTAENGSTVTLTVGGATYVTSASSGGWAVDLATAVPASGTLGLRNPGSNPVSVTATDDAGNTSPATTQTLVIGDPAPGVTSVAVPANGVYGIGQALMFVVSTQEPVQVDTTGGTPSVAVQVGTTTTRADYVSGSGTTALVFRVTVQAGWQDADGITVGSLTTNGATLRTAVGADLVTTLNSVGATVGVLVDGLAPVAPVAVLLRDTGASATDGVTSDGRVGVSGLEQGGTWEWSTDTGATWSTGTGDELVLPEGDYPAGAVRVRQTDAAGNTGPAWLSGALLIDRSAPTPPVLDPTPVRADAGPDAQVGVLTATDTSGTPTFALVAGTGDADNARFSVQGDRLVLHDPTAAGAGPRTVRVAAVDLAGNRSETVLVVEIDHAATSPVQAVTVQPSDRIDVVPGATATFSVGLAEPGLVAAVRWQVASSAAAPDAGTAWRDVPGADGLALSVAVAVGGDAWYRAVATGTDGVDTVSEPARLSVWDVRVHAGTDHADLATRFPDAADLTEAAPGLDLADLPGTVTLSLPWTGSDTAVTAFVYSDPTYLGTFAVAAGRVTLSGVALDAGEHYLVLVGVDSGVMSVLHYDTTQTTASSGGAVTEGSVTGGTAGTEHLLARTGAEPVAAVAAAALLLLTGTLLLTTTARRRRSAGSAGRR